MIKHKSNDKAPLQDINEVVLISLALNVLQPSHWVGTVAWWQRTYLHPAKLKLPASPDAWWGEVYIGTLEHFAS